MMNVQADSTSRRILVGLGLAVLLGFAAWRSLTLGLADHLSRSRPDAALAWRPAHPEAQLRRLDKQALGAVVPTGQEAAARAAIRAAPLDGRGYRLLAQQAERGGNLASARELYSLAAARGPRDLPTLRWLANDALARGDYARAIVHIDLMLRLQPELAQFLNRALIALSMHPPAQADVASMLLQMPPWRSQFMERLAEQGPDSLVLFPLMERLRRAPSGLADSELTAWIGRLARDREWGAAYLIWAQSLSPAASQRIGNVYNGSFEREPSHSGFDWRFDQIPGAQVSRAQVTGAKDHLALRVAFEDRRVPFKNVRQLLALAPGKYRLGGQARLDDLRSERGLVWTLTCAEDQRPIGETEPMSGRREWTRFTLDFEVPLADCGGQWLTLRVPARIPAEQLIGGAAWFDDLQIQAVSR
jgi:tetratricopeptide (TPR) repeat protein